MRLTRQSEIAIGILVQCAAAAAGTRLRTADLAENCGTTRVHAAQVTALLARHGLLEGERGRSGGVRLAKDPAGITLSDILGITQPGLVPEHDCLPPRRSEGMAILHAIIDGSQTHAVRLLRRLTLQDLVTRTALPGSSCIGCPTFGRSDPTPLRPQAGGVHTQTYP